MKLSEEQINKIMQNVWVEYAKEPDRQLNFTVIRRALKDFKFKVDNENLEENVSSKEKDYNKLLYERIKKHNEQFKVGDEVLYVLPIRSQETKQQFEYVIAKAEIMEIRKENAKIKILKVIREVTGNGIFRYYQKMKLPYYASLQYLYPKDNGHLGA